MGQPMHELYAPCGRGHGRAGKERCSAPARATACPPAPNTSMVETAWKTATTAQPLSPHLNAVPRALSVPNPTRAEPFSPATGQSIELSELEQEHKHPPAPAPQALLALPAAMMQTRAIQGLVPRKGTRRGRGALTVTGSWVRRKPQPWIELLGQTGMRAGQRLGCVPPSRVCCEGRR